MSIFKKFINFLYLACIFLPLTLHASPQRALTNSFALKRQGSEVSVYVKCLEHDQTLAQISPDLHLIPASTTKIALAAQSLDTWGSKKTFRSTFLARGPIKNGVLEGDLVFVGGGDPAFLNENMPDFIDKIHQSGIEKINGQVIVNNSLFGAFAQDKARSSSRKYSQNAYDAPLSAAAVNYSVLGVSVNPGGKVGAKPHIQIDPYKLPSITIINRATTSKKGSRTRLTVERNSTPSKDIYTIRGSIALNSKEKKIYRSVSNPERYAGEVLAAYLNSAGIKLKILQTKIENTPPQKTDKVLFRLEGSPLSDHLNGLLKQSNNFIADMLLMDLNLANGQKFQQKKDFTIQDQSGTLEDYLKKRLKDKKIVIKSGSGLTPENRLSSKNLVSLLNQIYQDKDQFDIFLNALTTPGEVGTLEYRFKKYASIQHKTVLRAKTGTLSSPRYVVSLAGYGRTIQNKWIGFAFIVNTKHTKNAPGILTIQDAIDKDVMSLLLMRTTRK